MASICNQSRANPERVEVLRGSEFKICKEFERLEPSENLKQVLRTRAITSDSQFRYVRDLEGHARFGGIRGPI